MLSSLSLSKKLWSEMFSDSIIYLSRLSIFCFIVVAGWVLKLTLCAECWWVLLGSIPVTRKERGGIWLKSEDKLLCNLTALPCATEETLDLKRLVEGILHWDNRTRSLCCCLYSPFEVDCLTKVVTLSEVVLHCRAIPEGADSWRL